MSTSLTGNGGSSLFQYGISDICAEHRMTNSLHGDSNTNVGNVSKSYNNTINVGIDEEGFRIHEWLSPLEPNKRHQDVRNRRLDGIGEWVLQRSEFESWRGSRDGSANSTLLCYGGQGVGKTYIRYKSILQKQRAILTRNTISSLVIDTLRKQTRGQNVAVLSLYCDYQAQRDQSAVNMIGALLRQVALRALRIPSEIKSAFDEAKQEGGEGLRLPDMVKLFVRAINSIDLVYLCVDAVDEVLPRHRPEFFRALRQIIQDAANVRLLLTGRPYIRGEVDKHLTKGACIIQIVADQRDIMRYLSQRMDDDQDSDLMTECLRNDIMETMLETTSGM